MLGFTRALNAGDKGYLFFTFNGIYSSQKLKYQVSVQTREHQCHHFILEQKNDSWKIVSAPMPPLWIMALETVFEKVIIEHRGTTTIQNMNAA